ncbi:MAG: DUF2723 domain-containing protein, partial [Deltaproteobacteria bacterium]|nr:DUF2723 domain-containing protein [Deltaproteobacteria bacterium]
MGAIVFVASFAIYAAFAAPALGWLDSAEFVAAAATLGVPHSPGHPLQALLSNLATLVPVGDVAIRVNLLSSACMATANLLLYRGLVELGQWQADGVSARWLEVGAGALTLSLGLAAPLWVQAGRAEVYALHTALLTGALWTAIRYLRADRSSDLIAFGLISGLALATHHFIALTLLVPCTAVVLWARKKDGSATAWVLRPSVRGLAMAVPAGALGLVAFAYLPLRAARDPLLNWGNPDTLGRLWWTISGRAFSGSLVDDHSSSLTTDLMQVLAATLISAPALLVLSLLGIYAALRLGKERALLATCVATVGLVIVGRALLG